MKTSSHPQSTHNSSSSTMIVKAILLMAIIAVAVSGAFLLGRASAQVNECLPENGIYQNTGSN